jgi:hypothetical protein
MRLAAVLLAASLGCVGCGFDLPTGPAIPGVDAINPPPPIQPVIPVPGRAATSSLIISRLSFGAKYSPSVLVLTETSGKNAATVDAIDLSTPNGTSDRDCVGIGGPGIRIPAGQSRDLARDLGYCMPYLLGTVGLPSVTLRIAFLDDDGGMGELVRTIDLASCTSRSGALVCDGLDR